MLACVVSMTRATADDSSHDVSSGVSESDSSDHVDMSSIRAIVNSQSAPSRSAAVAARRISSASVFAASGVTPPPSTWPCDLICAVFRRSTKRRRKLGADA